MLQTMTMQNLKTPHINVHAWHEGKYIGRELQRNHRDLLRRNEFGRLRNRVFGYGEGGLCWDLPLIDGRDCDIYDCIEEVNITCIYEKVHGVEYLLGGMRTYAFPDWDDTFLNVYMRTMIPDSALAQFMYQYSPENAVEITRFCTELKSYLIKHTPEVPIESLTIARDWAYASVYRVAESVGRPYGIAVLYRPTYVLMLKNRFKMTVYYEQGATEGNHKQEHCSKDFGFVLVAIDLPATLSRVLQSYPEQGERMASLLQNPKRFMNYEFSQRKEKHVINQ